MNATNKTLQILHIEDDETQAEQIWSMLEKRGIDYRVTLVTTFDAYREALREGGIDIVFSDCRGDDFDGEEALHYAHAHHPGIPFLFLSGSYEDYDLQVLKEAGAAACLRKWNPRDLVPTLQRVTNAFLSPA